LQSAKADPQLSSEMAICGYEKKGAKENSCGTAGTTNSVTIAEHMNLDTILFSRPWTAHCTHYCQPAASTALRSNNPGDNLNISTFETRRSTKSPARVTYPYTR
jgi:hypothetical protein